MGDWATFWKWLLIGTSSLFGLLAVAVTIGGFFDVRALFKTSDAEHEAEESRQDPGDG